MSHVLLPCSISYIERGMNASLSRFYFDAFASANFFYLFFKQTDPVNAYDQLGMGKLLESTQQCAARQLAPPTEEARAYFKEYQITIPRKTTKWDYDTSAADCVA